MAKRLVSLGANVVLVGRNCDKLDALRTGCLALESIHIETIACDITAEDSIMDMVRVLEETGGLDILVNAVGVVINAPLEETNTEDFDRILQLRYVHRSLS